MSILEDLESESIEIIREVMASASKPVMLYSIGKDSSVMLRLAQKAFFPSLIPFPLMHIDTGWKFPEMIDFRDLMQEQIGFDLINYTNPRGNTEGIGPISHGSALHTDIMKTEALKQALDLYGFDVALGGARRDEEKSRAKERVFSFRSEGHRWDPKAQRPELWALYNAQISPGETIRVFPLSNWTEADIWAYIAEENIPIVPLYFAAKRPCVKRNGQWIMRADERLPLEPGEVPEMRQIRFRTLGCYPLSAGIESTASNISEILVEVMATTQSERQGRIIDRDGSGSMERKKQEGYF